MGIIEGAGVPARVTDGAPGAGTTEVQTLTLSAVPASGVFQVAFDGFKTADLAFDVSAAAMQVALRALPSIDGANVGVGLVGQVYTLTFAGNLAKLNVPACTIPKNTVKDAGAAAVTITVATSTPGVTADHRGTPKGGKVMDTTNGVEYINTGTPEAPTWTKVGAQ